MLKHQSKRTNSGPKEKCPTPSPSRESNIGLLVDLCGPREFRRVALMHSAVRRARRPAWLSAARLNSGHQSRLARRSGRQEAASRSLRFCRELRAKRTLCPISCRTYAAKKLRFILRSKVHKIVKNVHSFMRIREVW